MDKTIYHMSVAELETQIQQKEIEYKNAIGQKKVFWELKKILEQKRSMERELIKMGASVQTFSTWSNRYIDNFQSNDSDRNSVC